MGFAKTEQEWAERAARHLKAELKRADLTYEELADRLKKRRALKSLGQHRKQVGASYYVGALLSSFTGCNRPRGSHIRRNLIDLLGRRSLKLDFVVNQISDLRRFQKTQEIMPRQPRSKPQGQFQQPKCWPVWQHYRNVLSPLSLARPTSHPRNGCLGRQSWR